MAVAALAFRQGRSETAAPSFVSAAQAHLDAVHRYLTQLTRDPDLAEDLTAETFERAFRQWRTFDAARGPVLPWLVAIARRIALDHFRSDRRRQARESRYTSMSPSAHEDAVDGGLPPHLSAALATLSDTEREVVALRVLLDLDGAATAEVLGITASACSTHLHRAMTKLRRELER